MDLIDVQIFAVFPLIVPLFNPLDGEGSVRELDVAVGREHKGQEGNCGSAHLESICTYTIFIEIINNKHNQQSLLLNFTKEAGIIR